MNNLNALHPLPRGHPDEGSKSAMAADLRRLLREKFPGTQISYKAGSIGQSAEAETESESPRLREMCPVVPLPHLEKPKKTGPGGEIAEMGGGRFLRTGVAALDQAGLDKGAITELVADPGLACGAGLVVAGLIREAAREGRFVALVDALDTFDPHTLGTGGCRSLLWVRCGAVGKALQATDFLLRDGNLPLVVIDLQLCCHRELGRVPGSTWFRLRSLAEHTGAPLLAITPRPLISCARLRLGLPEKAFALAALELPETELVAALQPEILRRRNLPGIMEATRMAG